MESIANIFTGKGSQTGGTANGSNRWGDYSGLAIDPSNDCTFWYVNEYIPSNGSFNFHTRIASFKFPSWIGLSELAKCITDAGHFTQGGVKGVRAIG